MDGACQEFVEKCAEGQVPLEACTITKVETAPFAGGTGQTITFTGTKFGSGISGDIIVPNADDGGLTGVSMSGIDALVDKIHFEKWEDDEIVMSISEKPSVITGGVHGSGNWTINPDFTNGVILACYKQIEIQYNLNTEEHVDTKKMLMIGHAKLPNENPNGSIEWYIQEGIDTDPILQAKGITFADIFAVADQAFCDWSTLTGFNFEYKGTSTNGKNETDGKNVLHFSTSIPDNVLMRTSNRFNLACNEGDLYFSGRLFDSDIAINKSKNWFVDLGNGINDTQFDFYSVILHEIGHMLQLNHAMDLDPNTTTDDPSIMYWQMSPKNSIIGQTGIKRTIDNHSVDGLVLLYDRIIDAQLQNQCFYNYLFNTSAPSCPSTVSIKELIDDSELVIPTITEIGKKIVILNMNEISSLIGSRVYLYDFLGNLISMCRIDEFQGFETTGLLPGPYFVRFTSKKGSVNINKKVVLIH
ncbi:MAG TPA: matrixin family metalloprotease [Bacteroidetes bacterium]|nr:matrixin family metalloprotease [Bacteroidota bacterium]